MSTPFSFPVLNTERLLLRQLRDEDEAEIFYLRSDETVNRYIGRPRPADINEAKAFIHKINTALSRNESFYWAISLKEDPSLIGTICIWNITADRSTGELGYELSPAFQGKGIMNEAIGRVIDFAFNEAGFTNLEAYTNKANTRSTKLLTKHQFTLVPERNDPDRPDNIIFMLTRDTVS